MAFIDSTKFDDIQSTNQGNEARISKYGLIDLAIDSGSKQDYISPDDIEAHRTVSGARNIVMPSLIENTPVVVTTPGFDNIPINLGESGTYTLTAYNVFSGMRWFPSMHENNQIKADFYFKSQMDRVLRGMADTKAGILETVCESAKTRLLDHTTQVSQGDGTYVFNAGTDTLEISKAAQIETMPYNLTQLMAANKLDGNYSIVTSPGGGISMNVAANKYGGANEKNLSWAQAAIPMEARYIDHQISTSANFNGFLVRDGGLGIIQNYPYDFRVGTQFGNVEWSVTNTVMPYVNAQLNVFISKEAADTRNVVTGANDTNGTMSHYQSIALWDRFYVFTPFISDADTLPNVIVKLEGKTS
mgnify:CR=1 FL=1